MYQLFVISHLQPMTLIHISSGANDIQIATFGVFIANNPSLCQLSGSRYNRSGIAYCIQGLYCIDGHYSSYCIQGLYCVISTVDTAYTECTSYCRHVSGLDGGRKGFG